MGTDHKHQNEGLRRVLWVGLTYSFMMKHWRVNSTLAESSQALAARIRARSALTNPWRRTSLSSTLPSVGLPSFDRSKGRVSSKTYKAPNPKSIVG